MPKRIGNGSRGWGHSSLSGRHQLDCPIRRRAEVVLTVAGARNVYDSLPAPSPTVSFEDLLRRDPDLVLASAAARAKMLADPKWRTLRAVREGRVLIFDTTIVNGPSARVGANAAALARLLHPDAVQR